MTGRCYCDSPHVGGHDCDCPKPEGDAMSTHSSHDPILTHGLADGCARCDEISDDPFTGLDDAYLMVLAAIAQHGDGKRPRSSNEGRAAQEVLTVLACAGRLVRLGVEL